MLFHYLIYDSIVNIQPIRPVTCKPFKKRSAIIYFDAKKQVLLLLHFKATKNKEALALLSVRFDMIYEV